MSEPRVRFTGHSRPGSSEVLSVDYQDVLRQAVENERWRVLRSIRRSVESIKTTEPDGRNSRSTKDRGAEKYKRDVLTALDAIEREPAS